MIVVAKTAAEAGMTMERNILAILAAAVVAIEVVAIEVVAIAVVAIEVVAIAVVVVAILLLQLKRRTVVQSLQSAQLILKKP